MAKNVKSLVTIILTVMLMAIGCRYTVGEMVWVVVNEDYSTLGEVGEYSTLEGFANTSLPDVEEDLKYNYFSYDIDDNIFCNYIMKR